MEEQQSQVNGGEGSNCTCLGGETGFAHQQLLARVDNSFRRDIERRASAPTTQTMRAKVLSHRNGHS